MNPATGRPWTEEEDARIRADYARLGAARIAREIERTKSAVWFRASRLGVKSHPRWNEAGDRMLRTMWGDYTARTLGSRLGRTTNAIVLRAKKLGLQIGIPQGFECVKHAAERSGLDATTLLRELRRRKAEVRFTLSIRAPRRHKFKRVFVDPLDVDEAVAAWVASEPIETAAKSRGVDPGKLRAWLRAAGVKDDRARPYGHWRVDSAVIDRVVAAGRAERAEAESRETVDEASARLGVHRHTLVAMLRAAGVTLRGKPFRLPAGAADDVIGAWRAHEDLRTAARRVGTAPSALERWLVEAGVWEQRRPYGDRLRMPAAVIDRVVADRRALEARGETVTQGAARVGVSRCTLGDWLRDAGITRGPGGLVSREMVDRVAAERRARATCRAPSTPRFARARGKSARATEAA